MKRKIAFISEHASPLAVLGGTDSGGQNVYVDKLTKQLTRLGYDIDIYTRWDDERLPEVVDCQNGIRVVHVSAGPKEKIRKEDMLQYMDQFTNEMLGFIKSNNLDYQLVHANFFMSGLVASEIKRKLGIPFVITFHALGKVRRVHQGKADTFSDERFTIEEKIVREADQIIAECPQDREDLLYHYWANQDKISIIPCGFDPNEFYPQDKHLMRMTLGLPTDEKIILQLGRMVPRKGVDTVIDAIALLQKKEPEIPTRLVIVGGESDTPDPEKTPEIGRLMNRAKKLGVLEKVVFVGRKNRETLRQYYNASDVFVSTPWYEPFGITPLEAMACGTPVIGSNVGGIKFSVINNKTGFLVPPKNPGALADKLKTVLTDNTLHETLRENALSRVNSFFTWEMVAKTMSTLYEKIFYQQFTNDDLYKSQETIITNNFRSLIATLQESQLRLRIPTINAAKVATQCLSEGGKILLCGNGGSATDAQHFAAELVGHFQVDNRPGLPALSLTTDTAVLTAVGNDYSFDEVFARQVEAYGNPGDVLIGISTSGNSENVMRAFEKARRKNIICIGLLGKEGGKMVDLCDIPLVVPSQNTQQIQEVHTHLIHTICELIEKQLFSENPTEEFQQPLIGLKLGKTHRSQKGGDKNE